MFLLALSPDVRSGDVCPRKGVAIFSFVCRTASPIGRAILPVPMGLTYRRITIETDAPTCTRGPSRHAGDTQLFKHALDGFVCHAIQHRDTRKGKALFPIEPRQHLSISRNDLTVIARLLGHQFTLSWPTNSFGATT